MIAPGERAREPEAILEARRIALDELAEFAGRLVVAAGLKKDSRQLGAHTRRHWRGRAASSARALRQYGRGDETTELDAGQRDAEGDSHRSIRARVERENLSVASDRVVRAAGLVEQPGEGEERAFVPPVSTDPTLELENRACSISLPRQLEDTILHRLTWRALAIATRAKLSDCVLPSMLFAPQLIRFCITSVVSRGRNDRRHHLGRRHRIGKRRCGERRRGGERR